MVVTMDAAAGAGDQDSAAPAAAAGISGEEASTPTRGRAQRPRIDYDESIAHARQSPQEHDRGIQLLLTKHKYASNHFVVLACAMPPIGMPC